jgi:hypothetical protein
MEQGNPSVLHQEPAVSAALSDQSQTETLAQLIKNAAGTAHSTLERYRYAVDQILPVLLTMEDSGERAAALKDVCKALKLGLKDLSRIMTSKIAGSNAAAKKTAKDEKPLPGTERYSCALELLQSPKILTVLVDDLDRLGYVGETTPKQLAFLCAISALRACRFNRRPMHRVRLARTSSGMLS